MVYMEISFLLVSFFLFSHILSHAKIIESVHLDLLIEFKGMSTNL